MYGITCKYQYKEKQRQKNKKRNTMNGRVTGLACMLLQDLRGRRRTGEFLYFTLKTSGIIFPIFILTNYLTVYLTIHLSIYSSICRLIDAAFYRIIFYLLPYRLSYHPSIHSSICRLTDAAFYRIILYIHHCSL